MTTIENIIRILKETLDLQGDSGNELDENTILLGGIPEFDSMAVISVITALQDYYDIVVEDDEISADTFETIGSLADFIENKL